MSILPEVREFQKVSDTVCAMGCGEVGKGIAHDSNKPMRNVRVNLGIDEDLQMILEMDPSIIDLGISSNVQDYPSPKEPDKIIGRPPKSGGYAFFRLIHESVFEIFPI